MTLTVSNPQLLSDGSDAPFRQAIHDALGFSARLQEIRSQLGESIGLSGPAFSILIAIEHLGPSGDVGVSRVGEHLHLSGAFVTIEVAKLVKVGLVTKTPDPADGRRVRLAVTPAARALLDRLGAIQRPVNDAIFAGFSAAEFRRFADMMGRLVGGTGEALALLRFLAEQRRRQA